jgi:hypothetical protein
MNDAARNQLLLNLQQGGTIKQVLDDYQWATEHFAELDRQFAGEFVGISGGQVIAHAVDIGGVYRQAEACGISREKVACVPVPAFVEAPR